MMRQPIKILLVENGEMLRPLLCEILQREGYEVLAAKDAEEALSIWERHQRQVDLIVTDVMMPGISGKEMVDRLRFQRPDIKVIYVSGYNATLLSAGNKFGPKVVFLQKPFRPAELSKEVKEILDS